MFIVCLVLGLLRVSNSTLQIIAGIIIIAIIGLGSMSTIVLNIKSYGFFKGMGLTIFGVVYIVGAMIAVLGFAIALWNLFVQMLVAMLPWLLCAFSSLPEATQKTLHPVVMSYPTNNRKQRMNERPENIRKGLIPLSVAEGLMKSL